MSRNEKSQRNDNTEKSEEFVEKLVSVNRVAKTVKGGRRMAFAALIVVGDSKGRVGVGHGKAKEVPEAIKKATDQAKRSIERFPLKENRTIHHDVKGRFGAGQVVVRAADSGTGIIAGGPMRAVFEALGVQDIVCKSVGSSNPYNMIYATLDALRSTSNPRMVASRRGKKVPELFGKKVAEKANKEVVGKDAAEVERVSA